MRASEILATACKRGATDVSFVTWEGTEFEKYK